MRHLIIFNVLEAVTEIFCGTQIARVLMVNNSGDNLGELSAVQFCWFPVSLNESFLGGDKFIQHLRSKQMVEWRTERREHRTLFD